MATPETNSDGSKVSTTAATGAASSSAFTPEFPDAIALSDLRQTHAEYDPIDKRTGVGILDKYDDLYIGGRAFYEHIDNYLIKRSIEGSTTTAPKNDPNYNPKSAGSPYINNPLTRPSGGSGGTCQFEARKKRAAYTPIGSGIIDFMVSAVFQNPPAIVAAQPPKEGTAAVVGGLLAKVRSWFLGGGTPSSEGDTAYWHDLNRNCDGMGQDLSAFFIRVCREVMIHKRAYVMPKFGKSAEHANAKEQKDSGDLDATLVFLSARDVDDWQYDSRGTLAWVRTHKVEKIRSNPAAQPDTERHTWVYITKSASYRYELKYKNTEPPEDTVLVSCGPVELHDAGRLPVIQIPVPEGLWVMERLADTILALFNRQSAASWNLDSLAFTIILFKTMKDLGSVTIPDVGGFKVDPGEDVTIISPPADGNTAQQNDIDRIKEDLFLAIQAMVLVAAAKDEQGRQSGVAKQRDFGTLSTLLGAFAGPIRDSIEECVAIIRAYRGDDELVLAVQGLDKFDVQSLEQKLKNTESFLKLPDLPPSARKWATLDASLAMTANAPAEVREAVVHEIMSEAKVESSEQKEAMEPTPENKSA